ncbi:hypothetical protein [Alkalihalobacillus deserti]|uniref:hypothetical protein n=1 Tax=Alkalihalobacillus deserti TaxID=2879466 RepID=UPI001D14C852|nr:hypothetical protein [Alkalihalobacillus deserti]
MTIKMQRLVNVAIILLTWSTLPFLEIRNIKRFLPASFLIFLIEFITTLIGKKRKWWVFYNKPKAVFFGEFPYLIGPFFVGSLWILKWTYGNFKQFILLNAIVNAFFASPVARFAKKIKHYKLVRLNEFQFFLYYFPKAFLMYWFQYLIENKKNN